MRKEFLITGGVALCLLLGGTGSSVGPAAAAAFSGEDLRYDVYEESPWEGASLSVRSPDVRRSEERPDLSFVVYTSVFEGFGEGGNSYMGETLDSAANPGVADLLKRETVRVKVEAAAQVPIPEPATFLMVGLGFIGLVIGARKRWIRREVGAPRKG